MTKLTHSLDAWGTPEFEQVIKDEIQNLGSNLLPLQEALSHSSHVAEGDIKVVILNKAESEVSLGVKAGIFYSGIIAGACCSDDPTPNCEQNEYCELQFTINKTTAETTISLLSG